MKGKAAAHLVCYDIRDPVRLNRVHRLVSRWAVMIQYSVYYFHGDDEKVQALCSALRTLIDEKQDDVRIYPLGAQPKWHMMGKALFPPGAGLFGEGPLRNFTVASEEKES